MEDFNLVLFGFTGNLTQLKIIPALYELEKRNLLSDNTKIFGIGRKNINLESFLSECVNSSDSALQKLAKKTIYIQGDFENEDGRLFSKLQDIKGNKLYYLATYPSLYEHIFHNLKKFDLNNSNIGWVRIMIEKPFGNNLKSAKNLHKILKTNFNENQIFRVDHYIAKDAIEKLFRKKVVPVNVDSLQIIALEEFGIGKRGVYYDATGALVDVGQNHVLQMLAALVKDESTIRGREKVLANITPLPEKLVTGQYKGYLSEENVSKNSNTDTFFAFKTFIKNGEWKGIPIYIKSGKKLQKAEDKISIIYKDGKITSWLLDKSTNANNPYSILIKKSCRG